MTGIHSMKHSPFAVCCVSFSGFRRSHSLLRLATTLIALVFILSTSPLATAEDMNYPSSFGMRIGNWNLKPIVFERESEITIPHILALAVPGTTSGGNLVAILYTQENNGSWSAQSWESDDQPAIIAFLKLQYNISDEYDLLWGMDPDNDLQVVTTVGPPKEYADGMLTENELYALVSQLDDRAAVIDLLYSIGYAVANPPFESTSLGCSSGEFLDRVVGAAATVEGNPSETSEDALLKVISPEFGCVGPTVLTAVAGEIIDNPTRTSAPVWTPIFVTGCTGGSSTGYSYYSRCKTTNYSRTCGDWGLNELAQTIYIHCSQLRSLVRCRAYFCNVVCPGTPQPALPPCATPVKSFMPESSVPGTADTGWTGVSPPGCTCN